VHRAEGVRAPNAEGATVLARESGRPNVAASAKSSRRCSRPSRCGPCPAAFRRERECWSAGC